MSKTKDGLHFELLFDHNINLKERVIYLNDDISEGSLELFQKAFDELDKNEGSPIRIEISSYGGSVYDMLGMLDRMKSSPCHVITRGFGKILSAAAFILAAGDERFMGENSWFMIHEMSDWLKGTLTDLKTQVKHNEALEEQMNGLLERLSKGKTKAKTFEKLGKRDCYLNAKETLKLGLIDTIL